MSAVVDPVRSFLELERRLEREPEGTQGEIARGVYLMTPRPRIVHGEVQGNLFAALRLRFGWGEGIAAPEWLFVVEPEIRSEENLSRLVPDLAAWRRSTTGWPDLNATPATVVPEWVAEILSPTTERFDRREKMGAWGAMGVGYVWLVDVGAKRVETFANVRGSMVPGPVLAADAELAAEPFGALGVAVARLFPG
ncbi:MAG: Uma2 family endonuclease [Holophagales bacterium]|jgi:Uma2 family endonuclease|nr:Uma2 family endonuclease [Holophagales bacterium]MBK9966936.1 Uma2 family endonuclease [Holophagales bacterium]